VTFNGPSTRLSACPIIMIAVSARQPNAAHQPLARG
jgi:hypothetical protein